MTPKPKAKPKARQKRKGAGGRPPKPETERLDTQLGVRVDADTQRRLLRFYIRFDHLLSTAAVARAAVLEGLEAIERQPDLLLKHEPLTQAQAERIMMLHWADGGALGHAEVVNGTYRVGLFPGWEMTVGQDMRECESTVSFREALDKLASRFPPTSPLPWSPSYQYPPRLR